MTLAVISMALGIPISAIAVAAGKHPAGILGLIVVWIAIAAINITYTASRRTHSIQPPARRADHDSCPADNRPDLQFRGR
jgi:hypothetical protein